MLKALIQILGLLIGMTLRGLYALIYWSWLFIFNRLGGYEAESCARIVAHISMGILVVGGTLLLLTL